MVERTLPKPDTRVRFPSAARINHKPLASVRGFHVPNFSPESLPGAALAPRPLVIRTLQPVSRSITMSLWIQRISGFPGGVQNNVFAVQWRFSWCSVGLKASEVAWEW